MTLGPGDLPPETLGPGDLLPDLALTDTQGRTVRLAALAGEETLIIFLRHLA